ncbi:Beta-lactamase domain protein [Colletotrichum higginsianum IMI 349063]|uniref:Beta-lactamase domain protein n=2 Tax=Colletotrichum higginsianum TaxID=80884 RepID=A0A1B7Y4F6_COLHI|nr:Beta-lactamase domain protein [Colletotrichum higginsianum IMI 349063]OBR06900.1 Beta-lactamase domain protein [Colletotrichum higginsianum IMI 349063]TIC92914.1 Metallo-beta-lactamase L1 type 3 [Colletotrichum higginsianum]GJC98967.1 betalactamase domain protein [Colletotrichum higginsianum]
MRFSNLHSFLVSGLALFPVAGKAQIAPLDQFFNKTVFPNEQAGNVTKYLGEAANLAKTWSLYQYFQDFCITQQVYPPLFQFPAGFVEPFSPFDRLIFVGHSFVSAWAYDTGDGLVLIDALDNPEEINAILLPGLEKFGFKGSDIKHCIITHEHVDHYGGAKYLKDTFNTTIWASEAAWTSMAGLVDDIPTPPSKDAVLGDGQELTVGNVTFTSILTPGHTPGTLSLIFPVFDKGVSHLAGMNGGTGIPGAKADREQKIRSQNHFADVARDKGVDTLISNHQIADHSLYHADLLNHRPADAPNPFVVGVKEFENYMRINALCTNVIAARQGMDLDI